MPWDGSIRDEIAREFVRLSGLPELQGEELVRSTDRTGERTRILTCTFAGCGERRRSGRGERFCDQHRGRHRGTRLKPLAKSATRIRSTCIACRMPIVSDVFHLKCAVCR